MTRHLPTEDILVAEGERPTRAQIATRIDLGFACYHEICCHWMLTIDTIEHEDAACDCGGEEMAKAYAEGTDSDHS